MNMDHDKRSLVDLPELVLQSLACKLNTSDLLTFRHTCKRFHNISLSSVLLSRHVVDLRKVKAKDLHHFRNFLHSTNYGRAIRFVVSDRRLQESTCNTTPIKCVEYAKNMENLECDISMTPHVVRSCHRIVKLKLKDRTYVHQYHNLGMLNVTYASHRCNFDSTLHHLTVLHCLQDLDIKGMGEVSIDSLIKLSRDFRLKKLTLSHGLFTLTRQQRDAILEEESSLRKHATRIEAAAVLNIEVPESSIVEWTFKHVQTEGFRLILPRGARCVRKSYSPDVLWHPGSTRMSLLKLNERSFHNFKQSLPGEVDHLDVKLPFSTCPNNSSVETSGFISHPCPTDQTGFATLQKCWDYEELTLHRATQPQIVKRILCNCSRESRLKKIRLVNTVMSHSMRGSRGEAVFKWHNTDIVDIINSHPNMVTLVLENFVDLSFGLLPLVSKLKCELKVLKLVNCRTFGLRGLESRTDVQNVEMKFRLHIIDL